MSALLDQLVKELETRLRAKDNTGGLSPYYTGPGGLFGVPGLEQDVISTRVQPRGIAGMLPSMGSRVMNPLVAYLTGFTADEDDAEKNAVCDDALLAGNGKTCIQTAQFGRYERATRQLELNRVGQQINRGEFLDLRVINDPLLQGTGDSITPNVNASALVRQEMLMRMLEVGIAFQNKLSRQVYIGNPANNTAGGGYEEFPGLEILVGTNKVDAMTGITCPSLNSDIKDFAYRSVDLNGGLDIVNYLTYMLRYLNYNANRMGLDPVTFTLVMRQELFYELTAVWPCAYLTYRCQLDDNPVVMANDQVALRDAMRTGNYLLVDGVKWPVVTDTAIPEQNHVTHGGLAAGSFASDIYILPMTYMGGRQGVYWEYYDYAMSMEAAAQANYASASEFWTDGGRFLWTRKPQVNWCIQLQAKIEPRLRLPVPQLAGRLTNVAYTPLQHTRDPFPEDPYFVNGGQSTAREIVTPYSEWDSRIVE